MMPRFYRAAVEVAALDATVMPIKTGRTEEHHLAEKVLILVQQIQLVKTDRDMEAAEEA